jgi:pimeloyl-ACP methyl ester carboxylesterase
MRERFVQVDGLELCLCCWGPDEGRPLFILHGLMDQGASWAPVAEPLAARGFRVFAPDARGHGRSGHVGPGGAYHFLDYVRDLDGLVAQIGGPVDLVGHSMGATTAALFAGARPEQVRRLVLIEGLGPPHEPDSQALSRLRKHLDQHPRPRPHRVFASLEQARARLQRAWPQLDADRAEMLAARVIREVPGGLTWSWDARHRTRSASGFDRDRFLAVAGGIQAHTVLILGATSWYAGLSDLDQRQLALGGVERLSLPTGHNPHVEAPLVLTDMLLGLLP